MKKTVEIISVTVTNGLALNSNHKVVQAGEIIGMWVKYNALNNPGMVRAYVSTTDGTQIVDLQHVDNLRSREAAFHDSYYPICLAGGQDLTAGIISDENNTDDAKYDFAFVYKQ